MKNRFKIALPCLAIACMLASCEMDEPLDFQVLKPLSAADREFLNAYDALKTYVDRSANPNFKLSADASISDFTDKGMMYRLLTSNFDQLAPMDGMTHGSIVLDNGAFDFGNIPAFLPVAGEAGISIFGPALVWHAQQRADYLNDEISSDKVIDYVWVEGEGGFGEMIVNGDFKEDDWSASFRVQNGGTTGALTTDGQGPNGKGRALVVTNPEIQSAGWGSQMIIVWDTPMLEGEEWTFKMDYKSDVACDYGNQAQAGAGDYMFNDLLPSISSTPTWQTLETTFIFEAKQADKNKKCTAIAFDLGNTPTNYYFANVSLYKHPFIEEVETIENGDFEDDLEGWNSWGNDSSREHTIGAGVDGSNCLEFTNPSVASNAWDAQVAYEIAEALKMDAECTLSFMVKASVAGEASCQIQNPGYTWCGNFGSFELTTGWTKITLKTTITEAGGNQLTFNFGHFAGTVYMDDVSLIKLQEGGSPGRYDEVITYVPKAPEEQKRIITGELESWIEGIMEEAGEYVKDWTVVNEPMDDANPSQLRTAPANPGENDFYWQDYLGKDYARMTVKWARQYGGEGLKLFVNDNGLVNKDKCQGLINMISYWEQDGTTKIDGIGTQMNLTCSLDAATQKTYEDAVVEMFNSLKATGKLIRISALDMRIANADGELIAMANVTREQQLAMSKYCNFVVRKYFEIVPAAQRYGIAVNPIESTSNAGLWDNNYSRKFTFPGFANGLAGDELKYE